ncbi:NUDIX domain-containing protein [Coxiella-like endosymbiont]|uniref:NUDIX domain-containing protein n=1 Tax=Coxiella-like endosymbiont TaxID=1592897 RepID=UPI002729ECEF|nr:NUDIX domain-containing protein [Coxiella-like endosymbiont]
MRGCLLHVAVGLVTNLKNEVLVSLRPMHMAQGGLWKFPGGKLEPGENSYEALCRELKEELNITVL